MVVTFIEPLPGEGFALGYIVQPRSDLIGPIPNDSIWIVAIQHIEESNVFLTQDNILSPTTNPPPKLFGEQDDGRFFFPAPQPKIAIGDDVRLLAELRSPTLGTQDTGSIIVKWRPQESEQYVIQKMGMELPGGFADSDRSMLKHIESFAWLDIVDEWLPDLVDWVQDRIRRPPRRVLVDPDMLLEFQINPPVLNMLWEWVGIEWLLIQYPPGWQASEGNPDFMANAFMSTVLWDSTDLSYDHARKGWYERQITGSVRWGTNYPSKITGYVMPGGVVRFWYLVQINPEAQDQPALETG